MRPAPRSRECDHRRERTLDAGQALVASTLAFTAKVAAVRRDLRVALLAGGCLIRGRAALDVDLTSKTFDERVRSQELRKYPPARRLLAIPGHRRLLWWYVGRTSIAIPLDDCTPAPGSDRITVSFVDGELPRIVPLDPATDVSADEIPAPAARDGAACLLVHDAPPARTARYSPAGPGTPASYTDTVSSQPQNKPAGTNRLPQGWQRSRLARRGLVEYSTI